MPTDIESRIVSMVFDNKQFEKNVATSQKTLKELDEQLKFKDADKGFKNITAAASEVSFSSMTSKIEDIGVKLRASSVIGIEVLKRLTNSAIDFAKTWANKVMDPIMSGGWNRATSIDNAKFQLQGLGIAWEEISEDIDYGVKDTAYGLGAAATAAAQFAASGVELGDNMKTALRGISGVAAMTNSTYEDISSIFTGIAGANRVFGDDLNRLASRGLNATRVLGDALGKSETEIKDMVSKGKIDFATFAQAMDDAFGEHAKKGNETFEGSLANMKSALGRIGAEFASSYRAQMIPVWNALRITINDVKKTMGPVFETADAIMTDLSERFSKFVGTIDDLVVKGGAFKVIFEGVADLMEGIYEIGTTIVDTIADAYELVAPSLEATRGLVENIEDFQHAWKTEQFTESVRPFAEMAKSFKEMVQSQEFIDKLVTGVHTVLDIFARVRTIVAGIYNFIKTSVIAFKEGFGAGSSDNLKGLLSIQGVLSTIKRLLGGIANFINSNNFFTFAQKVANVVKTVGSVVATVLTNFQNVAGAISEAWNKVFPLDMIKKIGNSFGPFFDNIIGTLRSAIAKLGFSEDIYDSQVKHFETLFNVVKSLKRILSTVAQAVGVVVSNFVNLLAVARSAFYEIFDGSRASDFAKKLNQVIWSVQNFINKLLFSETALENFKRFFKGVFAVVDVAKDIFTTLFHIVSSVFTNIMGDVTRNTEGAVDGLSGFLGRIGDILVKMRDWLDENEVFEKVGKTLTSIFGKVINIIRSIVDWIIRAKDSFAAFVERVTGSTIGEHFQKLGDNVKEAWERIKNFFKGMAESDDVSNAEKKISPIQTIFDTIKTALGGLFDFLQKVWPTVQKIFTVIGTLVTNLFSAVGDALSSIGSNTNGMGAGLVGAVGGIAGIAGSFNSLSANLLTAAKQISGPLFSIRAELTKFQTMLQPKQLLKIAAAIGIMALSIVALASVDTMKLAFAIGSMKTLVNWLKQFMKDLYQLASDMGMKGVRQLRKLTTGLVVLGAAMLIFAVAVKKLGSIETEDLVKGTLAMYALLTMLSDFAKELSKIEKSIVGASASMILIAVAMAIMVIPMKALAKLGWEEIAKGLVAIGGLLLEFVVVTRLLQGGNAMLAAGTVIMLSEALLLLVIPMKIFSKMDWEEIARGLAAVGGLLLEFVLVTKLLKGGGAMLAAGTVLMLSTALLMMTIPMKIFSKMDWEEIAKGLVAVGGLLLEFVLATKLIQGGSAVLAAGTMILMAAALNMLIIPLKAFGSMSWGEIGKGLLVVAGALGVLIIAGTLAGPAAVGILALAAALVMIGVATMAIGAGIVMMATGLQIMTGIGPEIGETIKAVISAVLSLIPEFFKAIMAGLQVIVTGILELVQTLIVGIFTMFPQIVSGVLNLLGNILNAIVDFLPNLLEVFPTIVDAFFFMITTIVSTFAQYAPELFDGLGIILREFLRMLNDTAPTFFELVKTIILGVIDVIRSTSPALIETVFEILLKTLEELAKNAADITQLVIDTLLSILEVLTTRLPEITLKVVEFVISLINSVADTLMQKAPEIRDAIAKLLGSIIKLTLEIFGFDTSNMDENEFTNIGKFLMGGFIGGIADKFPEFWQKIKQFFKDIGDWFKKKFEDFKEWGKNILDSLRQGVADKFEAVKEKITGFFGKIGDAVKKLFGINSPSKMFREFGVNVMQGFQKGAGDENDTVVDKVKGFFGKIGDGVKNLLGIDKEDGLFAGFGKKIVGAFQKAVGDSSSDAESEVTGVFSKVTQAAEGSEATFTDIGKKLMDGLAKGMSDNGPTATKTLNTITTSLVNTANAAVAPFTTIGQNMIAGMVNGMNVSAPAVAQTASNVAHTAAKAAKMALKIQSPSKVFAEIGEYCDKGMVQGLNSYADLVAMAGEDIANEAIMSTAKAMAIASEMASDIDSQPTIRPVLDLSEIENGTSRIANILGNPTLGLDAYGAYTDWSLGQIKMGLPDANPNTVANTVTNNNPVINFTVNAAPGQDPEEIANAVQKRLKQSLDQRGYAFR